MLSTLYLQRIVQALSVLVLLNLSISIHNLLTHVNSHGTEDATSLIQSFLLMMSGALWLLVMRIVMNPAVVEALDPCFFFLIALFQFTTVLTTFILKQKNSLHRNTEVWVCILINVSSSYAVYYLTYSTEQRIKTEMKKKEENGMELNVPLLEQKESYVV